MFFVTTPHAAWALVVLSGSLEVIFAISMKYSDGYSRPVLTMVSIGSALLSVWLMSATLRVLPLGTAHAVWSGIGVAGTALVGVVWLHEPGTLARLACVGAVVAGIIGLQLQDAASA
jgi:quaternary ammonium compound-resistance protein SugE